MEITGMRNKEDPQIVWERSRSLIYAASVLRDSPLLSSHPPPTGVDVTGMKKQLFCAEGMEKHSWPPSTGRLG